MPKKPSILNRETVAKSQLFEIERIYLGFSNGQERIYERLVSRSHGAVMIVPLLDDKTVLLIREYAAGLDRYEITLPKGFLEPEEDVLHAANREIMEEVGYAARDLSLLKDMSAAPGYMAGHMHVVLAKDLYEKKHAGDEPEEIEVIPWQLDNLNELLARDDFSEARSIAALYIVRDLMNQ